MYKEFVSPILDRLDSETWHVRARKSLHWAEKIPGGLRIVEGIANEGRRFKDPRLRTILNNVIPLDNPLIVGAGWDKTGEAVVGLWQMGFAGVEVGSVLSYPQYGNPKPRQWMIGSGVGLNRLGFNSPGAVAVARNLGRSRYRKLQIPIGISIGKNKDFPDWSPPQAHAAVMRILYYYALYFVINVSSPNTPGLRKLQDKEPLREIAQAVMDENRNLGYPSGILKPVYVKIAPELTLDAVDDVIEVVVEEGLSGIIACNTTSNPDIKACYGEEWRNEAGGLSGDDAKYRRMVNERISHIYQQAGDRLTIIGCGGVKDTGTALEKIRLGATALQLVTAIRSEGPRVANRINRGISEYLDREGIPALWYLRGTDVPETIG